MICSICRLQTAHRRFIILATKVALLLLVAFCLPLAVQAQGNYIRPAPIPPEELDRQARLKQVSDKGDALLEKRQWNAAITKFQQILVEDRYNGYTYYGLAKAYMGESHWKEAAASFRILYTGIKDATGQHFFNVEEPRASMEYAITLSHLGQADEAVAVYNKAANALNYEDYQYTHRPFLEVPFPLFQPDGPLYYTPNLLQSLAHAVRGFRSSRDDKEDEADFHEAIRLDPHSAVAYYYLGRHLEGRYDRKADTRAAYLKASQLGSGPMLELIRQKFKALPKD